MDREKIIQFKEELTQFTRDVKELSKDGELSKKDDFLENIAQNVNKLYASASEVLKKDYNEIEEISAIVTNILVQPLKTEDRNVTFLNAAETFSSQKGKKSDLSEVMRQYVKYPETTHSFVIELELLTKEVETILAETG